MAIAVIIGSRIKTLHKKSLNYDTNVIKYRKFITILRPNYYIIMTNYYQKRMLLAVLTKRKYDLPVN